MITTTSLLHPSVQTKIKSVRVQAEHLGLVGKVYNTKGKIILVAVKYAGDDHATFYAVDKEGIVGKDVTEMVTLAVPYSLYVKPKTFFQRVVSSVQSVIIEAQAKVASKINPMFVYL